VERAETAEDKGFHLMMGLARNFTDVFKTN
jgi:hypothetical protein